MSSAERDADACAVAARLGSRHPRALRPSPARCSPLLPLSSCTLLIALLPSPLPLPLALALFVCVCVFITAG
jgi:hypothetical protein